MLLIRPSFSFENIRHIYFVAAHKLILNVSKIRLRLICARASYLYRLFSKVLFGNVQGCTFPNNGIRAASEYPQRIGTAKDGGDSMQNLRVFHTYSFLIYCRYYESYGSIFAEKNRPTSLCRRVLYNRRLCL